LIIVGTTTWMVKLSNMKTIGACPHDLKISKELTTWFGQ